MRTAIHLTINFLALMSTMLASYAEAPKAQPNPASALFADLYSDDENLVMAYLQKNPVPYMKSLLPEGTEPDSAEFQRQEERAVELFKAGSSRMRLAIAKSVYMRGMKYWEACGPDDYEAKHYLAGIALTYAKDQGDRQRIREWLLKEAHPSHASALLKNPGHSLFQDIHGPYGSGPQTDQQKREEQELLGFLKELYRQPGDVSFAPMRVELPGGKWVTSKPIQACVVELLPWTPAGRELAVQWLRADGKKVDQITLGALWKAITGYVIDQHDLSIRNDLAEAWLLFEGEREAYGNYISGPDLCAQAVNPDPRVRKKALEYVIKVGGWLTSRYSVQDTGYQAIASARSWRAMRLQALEEAKAIFAELKNAQLPAPVKDSLEKKYSRLVEALQPAPAQPPAP